MKKIAILIELEKGQVKETNHGVITLARQGQVLIHAFVLERVTDQVTQDLAAWGVHKVVEMAFPLDPQVRENPVVLAGNLVRAIRELEIHTILGLSSGEGRDLIPRMAALLDAPLVMDCMAVDLTNNIARTSQYSGKAIASIQLTGEVVLFGIRPNAVTAIPAPGPAQIITFEVDSTLLDNFRVVLQESAGEGAQSISLAEAEIIIAGGRGMKNKENFSLLFDCAKKMNAAVGASRVAVDLGWIPYAHQVGQTGEKVSPLVYIACGISGSIQHFAGMKTAKMIIAVNSDGKAGINANSDYYVTGDVLEIIPELTQQL